MFFWWIFIFCICVIYITFLTFWYFWMWNWLIFFCIVSEFWAMISVADWEKKVTTHSSLVCTLLWSVTLHLFLSRDGHYFFSSLNLGLPCTLLGRMLRKWLHESSPSLGSLGPLSGKAWTSPWGWETMWRERPHLSLAPAPDLWVRSP